MKTYNIRIRAEYTGYYKVKAKSLNDAEIKARQKLFDEMNDEVDGSFDFEEFEDEDLLTIEEKLKQWGESQ